MLALLIYVGVGAGLAIVGLHAPSFGRGIDRMAARVGMDVSYGRAVWLGGTILAWPIGLYVLATGRLVLVGTDLSATTDDNGLEAKPEEPLSTGPEDGSLAIGRVRNQASHRTTTTGCDADAPSC